MRDENLHRRIITSESGITFIVRKVKERGEWWVSNELIRGKVIDSNEIVGPILAETRARTVNSKLFRELAAAVAHPEYFVPQNKRIQILDPTEPRRTWVEVDPSTIGGINRFGYGWNASVPEPRVMLLDMKNIGGTAELIRVVRFKIPVLPESVAGQIYENPVCPNRIRPTFQKKLLENGLTVASQPNGPDVIYF